MTEPPENAEHIQRVQKEVPAAVRCCTQEPRLSSMRFATFVVKTGSLLLPVVQPEPAVYE